MYGQTPTQSNGYGVAQYALVFGAGLLLAGLMRTPLAAGAALYTLGFFVRGLPQTRQAIADAEARARTFVATSQRLSPWQVGVDGPGAPYPTPPVMATPSPVGAGVVSNPGHDPRVVVPAYPHETADGVVWRPMGRDFIDADHV